VVGRYALISAVLGAHLALLAVLGQGALSPSVLQPVATPLFTREIRAATPPPEKPAANRPSPQVRQRKFATDSIAPNAPDIATAPSIPASGANPVESTPRTATVTAGVDPVAAAPEATPAAAVVGPSTSSPPVALDDWPADTRLSYKLTGFYRGAINGDAQVQWQRQGDRYQVSIVIDLGLVSVRMTSQGTVGVETLAPSAYEEKVGFNTRPILLEPARIRLMTGEWLDRPPQVQDTASQFVALTQRFARQPGLLAVGKTVQLWLARPTGVDEWTYDIEGKDTLDSAHLGPLEAFHLKPRPLAKPRGPVAAEIWFAPSLQYLPARIRLSLGTDSWLDLMVEKIEQAGPALTPDRSSRP
jgi:hypothetical protein